MVDLNAFYALTSGLYFISSKDGDRKVGCLVNTVMQVTAEPIQISVTINKANATTRAIQASKRFTVSALAESATMKLIGTFGFKSSDDIDKFESTPHGIDANGHPYVTDSVVAWFSVRVDQEFDVGTHLIFVGEVEEAEIVGEDNPMSYKYYHTVVKGKTPPRASSFLSEANVKSVSKDESAASADGAASTDGTDSAASADGADGADDAQPIEGIGAVEPKVSAEEQNGEVQAAYEADKAAEEGETVYAWRCIVCGYLEFEYPDGLPDDYVCPICGVGKDQFERIEVTPGDLEHLGDK